MTKPRGSVLTSKLVRILPLYKKSNDGDAIELQVMMKEYPFISPTSWLARLHGTGVSSTNHTKLLPLVGRIRRYQGGERVLILASSFKQWLSHYNPHLTAERLDEEVKRLVKQTETLEEERLTMRRMRYQETINRRRENAEPKKKPEQVSKAKISQDVFNVWRR